jgi:N-acetylneuraminic acid mutarotase
LPLPLSVASEEESSLRKHRLLLGTLLVCLLGLAILSISAVAQNTAPNEWTWMGGSSTGNLPGVYGTLGTPAAGNIPGTRNSASSWTDRQGNFWLFGGKGTDSTGIGGYMNDLWEYSPTTKDWVWMAGGNTLPGNYAGLPGVYGILKTPSTANIPGSRWLAATWTDSSGNLWLFGGIGYDANGNQGNLNDLWEFTPSSKEWTWMGGSSTVGSNYGQPGVYGTLGTPAAGNIPGGRFGAVTWTDSKGNFWLFGGNGLDSGNLSGELNDLWEFNPSTTEWAWMGGSDTANQQGVYGTLGKPDTGNLPPGRDGASGWTDLTGNFWLFGGSVKEGIDDVLINDLWEFDPSTSEWTWMGGGSSSSELEAVYGTLGTPSVENIPGSRNYGASWTDTSGNLWLFGGTGFDSSATAGWLNDLWEIDLSSKEWTWMGGSNTANEAGIFGTLGTPNEENVPGSRGLTTSWTDSSGNFWLFGGSGVAIDNSGNQLNDLWEYQPSNTPNFTAAPAPVISPAGGAYSSSPTVTITDSMPAATIFYTLDGTTPTTGSYLYRGELALLYTSSQPITVNAIAVAPNYLSSAVATASFTFIPDFSVPATFPELTLPAGQFASISLPVTPVNGFNGTVSFRCSGLPTEATCSFSPATVTPSGGEVATKLIVTATAPVTAAVHRKPSPLFPASALAVALCCFGLRKRRRLQILLLVVLGVAGLGLLTSCGGGGGGGGGCVSNCGGGGPTPLPNTQTVTVTASSGSLSHTTTFTLTVN